MTKKWIMSCWRDFNILTKVMKERSQNMNSRKCWMPKDRCENCSNSEVPGPTLDSTLNPYLNGNLTRSVLNRSFITPKKVSIHLMNIWKKKWSSSTKLAIHNWILKSSKIFVKQFDWTMMSLTPKRLWKIRFAQGTHINSSVLIHINPMYESKGMTPINMWIRCLGDCWIMKGRVGCWHCKGSATKPGYGLVTEEEVKNYHKYKNRFCCFKP